MTTIRLMVGGEVGQVIQEEAQKRGISGAVLARIILGEWVKDSYKERMRGKKKTQNQSLVTTEQGSDELPADKDKSKAVITKVPEE